MSRPGSRRMLGILLLGLVAVAVSLTVLRQGFSSSSELERSYHFYYYGLAWKEVRAFNSSMLRYAEIDVLEEKLKKQAEQLLEGKFPGPWRYRSVAGARRRFNIHDPSGRSTTMIQAAYSSPLYSKYWPDFRRNLQDWARNKRFESEIMNDLVRLVKNPLDGHSGTVASGRRFASCAVVGNSGILLESSHGELIDSHEVVIRLNNARITGFERDVGSKTTVSFVNSHILHACARRRGCFCHPYGANVPMVMYMCQPVHFYDYAMCNSSLKAPLLITDPRFDILCARLAKYYSVRRFVEETGKPLEAWNTTHDAANFHYSSGMQAIMLAVGICDKVSVFGFGKSETTKHHYHTNQKAELALHDYQAEYDLYHDLVEMPQAIPFMSDKFKFPRVVVYQ